MRGIVGNYMVLDGTIPFRLRFIGISDDTANSRLTLVSSQRNILILNFITYTELHICFREFVSASSFVS